MEKVEHGTTIRVGEKRRDGKYPVKFHFKSTGSTLNKVMTKEALDAYIAKTDSCCTQVIGWPR